MQLYMILITDLLTLLNNQDILQSVIAISNSVKERLIKIGFVEQKITLIPNGIDVELVYNNLAHCNKNKVWDNICHRYLIEKSSFIVTLPGRRVPYKGHIIAFKALKNILEQRNIEIKLLITGFGMGQERYIEELERSVSKLGIEKYVTFLDEIKSEEMMALYYNSDLIITPSTEEEGFCYANIECMLVGKAPVITSNFGGVLDYIEHLKTGYLFPVGDHIALAQGIELLLYNDNLRKSLIENAKKMAVKFDIKNMISSYDNLLLQQ